MVFNIRIRIQVSAILIFVILFQAVLSLLSIQAALVLAWATIIIQEILTVKNRRMEKLSVGILALARLVQQMYNLIHLELYITTMP